MVFSLFKYKITTWIGDFWGPSVLTTYFILVALHVFHLSRHQVYGIE